ncbi:MAG: DNA primase [Acidimicrobiia bacterium]
MGILDDDVARVREATDLVALASEHLALKRVGRRYMGLCPFHSEKSPSFSINPELGLYYCFGCQARGDAITFLRQVEHLDFVEAVERLAGRAGITLHYDDANVPKDRRRNARLSEAVGAAIDVYHRLLLESPDAGRSRRYLRSRGFDGDVARQFKLGWAPEGFDTLSREFQRREFSRADLVDAGLSFVNRANKLQDQFRGRLMFPIYDGRGDPVGFGGRSLGDQGPKYKNSPETPIYQKSRLLYGLNWAKAEIVARGEVVLCEGYTDVIAFFLAGAPNAVATCGTALADDHFQILKNLARRITLAYDADSAGQAAAERAYQWEERYEVQFQVADLPPGRDPADVWRDDPEALLLALKHAAPFLQFRLERRLGSADLGSLEGRARAAEHCAAIIAQHPSELVRDQYVMMLADRLDIDADPIRSAVARRAGGSGADREPVVVRARSAEAVTDSSRAVDPRELDALRWAIHEPELVTSWLDRALFADPVARSAFDALVGADTFHEALAASDGAVRGLLERLAVEEPIPDNEPDTLEARLVVNTVEPAARRVLHAMQRGADERISDVSRLLDAVASARANGHWDDAKDAALELIAWVTQRESEPDEERGGTFTRSISE